MDDWVTRGTCPQENRKLGVRVRVPVHVCVRTRTHSRKPTITDKVVKPDLKAAEIPDMKRKCRQSQRVLSGHQYSLMRSHREDHNALLQCKTL